MREIKFRVWCEHLNKYVYDYLTGTSVSLNGLFIVNGKNKLVFEQYTGLKDINGVEIYEGDILKFKGGGLIVVKFEKTEETETFGHGHCGVSIFSGFKITGYYGNEFEVIGNIHQNKELLEVIK